MEKDKATRTPSRYIYIRIYIPIRHIYIYIHTYRCGGKESSRASKRKKEKNSLSIAICSCGPKRAKRAALGGKSGWQVQRGKGVGASVGWVGATTGTKYGCFVYSCRVCVYTQPLKSIYLAFLGPPLASIIFRFFCFCASPSPKQNNNFPKKSKAAKFSSPNPQIAARSTHLLQKYCSLWFILKLGHFLWNAPSWWSWVRASECGGFRSAHVARTSPGGQDIWTRETGPGHSTSSGWLQTHSCGANNSTVKSKFTTHFSSSQYFYFKG